MGRCFVLGVLFTLCGRFAAAHPGNGIVVLPSGSVITGDAVRNGVWKFVKGRRPEQIASSFHCHWVVAGLDGNVYAETVEERGGNWLAAHYRLDLNGRAPTRVGANLPGDTSRFAVDASGARIFRRDGRFVRTLDAGSTPFRGGGTLGKGEVPIGSIAAYAWGPEGVLYFADDSRIRSLDRSGRIKTVVSLKGNATYSLLGAPSGQRRIWGIAVSSSGDLLIADGSTGQVLRLRDGRESVVSRAQDGWMPTGIAVAGANLVVLESKLVGNRNLGPRVRMIGAEGRSEIIGTVDD